MYIVDKDGEKITLSDIEIFCECPKCGKEIEKTADFWEYVSQDSDFDIDSTFYCESCSEAMANDRRFVLENIEDALNHMPAGELKKFVDAVSEFSGAVPF